MSAENVTVDIALTMAGETSGLKINVDGMLLKTAGHAAAEADLIADAVRKSLHSHIAQHTAAARRKLRGTR